MPHVHFVNVRVTAKDHDQVEFLVDDLQRRRDTGFTLALIGRYTSLAIGLGATNVGAV